MFHGSRDPRPAIAVEQLAHLVNVQLQTRYQLWDVGREAAPRLSYVGSPYSSDPILTPTVSPLAATVCNSQLPLVGVACLELGEQPLHQQIGQFGDRVVRLRRQGVLTLASNDLQVVPLFLLPGVHVMEDIPAEVQQAQQLLGSDLNIQTCAYLGSHPQLVQLLAAQMTAVQMDAWVLLAHGSRRLAAHNPVEAIAEQLNAVPAYWSVPPDLKSQVMDLVQSGCEQIGILPYFLFAGGLTEAIATQVAELQQKFPHVNFYLADPVGPSAALANLVLDLALNSPS